MLAQASAARLGFEDMRFFGFDAFMGLPPVQGLDATPFQYPDGSMFEFQEGDYACGYDQVVENLDEFGVDWERTHLIQGWYSDLPGTATSSLSLMRPAAVILVDCDLYESTVPVLQFMEQFLQPGTVVMFDDWNGWDLSDDMGERRAFREFLARSGWMAEQLFDGGTEGGAAFRLLTNSKEAPNTPEH